MSSFREEHVYKKKLMNGWTDAQKDARQTTDHDISLLAYGQWSLKWGKVHFLFYPSYHNIFTIFQNQIILEES